jgi:hypothetical protein
MHKTVNEGDVVAANINNVPGLTNVTVSGPEGPAANVLGLYSAHLDYAGVRIKGYLRLHDDGSFWFAADESDPNRHLLFSNEKKLMRSME